VFGLQRRQQIGGELTVFSLPGAAQAGLFSLPHLHSGLRVNLKIMPFGSCSDGFVRTITGGVEGQAYSELIREALAK